MTSSAVNLTGSENLPPFVKSLLDPTYNYHSHQLLCEPVAEGFDYKYTVTVSKTPLDRVESENTTEMSTSDVKSIKCDHVTPLKCSSKTKCVMMVNVKFILLYNACGKRVQSMFAEEFSSDTSIQNVILSFQEVCLEKIRKHDFTPRFSFCIGDVTRKNSIPIEENDLNKTISQLAKTPAIGKFTIVADMS